MLQIYFEKQNRQYPFATDKLARLLNSRAVDWKQYPELALELSKLNEPVLAAIFLKRANLSL